MRCFGRKRGNVRDDHSTALLHPSLPLLHQLVERAGGKGVAEVIKVDNQQCTVTPAAGTGGEGVLQPVKQKPTIGQFGQWIIRPRAC